MSEPEKLITITLTERELYVIYAALKLAADKEATELAARLHRDTSKQRRGV